MVRDKDALRLPEKPDPDPGEDLWEPYCTAGLHVREDHRLQAKHGDRERCADE